MSICDFYLADSSGEPTGRQRDIGNRLLKVASKAGTDWREGINAFLPCGKDLHALPEGSWLLKVEFTLTKPFTSRSELEFRPWEERVVDKKKGRTEWFEIQNPIVRDHLTGLPMVKPTTWKGHFAFAAAAQDPDGRLCRVRERLFGTIRANESGQEGRLHFFPTFFQDQPSREVVTPLHRDTRTPARGPINFEVIGAGQRGRFCLLYVPRPRGLDWNPGQIPEDLEVAARAVKATLLDYGFSAKKTSGWGVTADSLPAGSLAAKGEMWPEREPAPKAQIVEPEEAFRKFMDAAGKPHLTLRRPSGEWLTNKEYKTAGASLGTLTEYKDFRWWYDKHGAEWLRTLAARSEAGKKPLRKYKFTTLTDLVKLADELATSLKGGHG